ncbi:MAG: BatD family protein, partial [Ghiorsea sp.]
MKKYLLLVLLLVLPQSLLAGAIATLDRGIASFGESVQLTIKVEGESADDPDLSLLKHDFDILSQSQSSNYTLINGSFNRSQQWAIHLMPKREGTLAIPAIVLGKLRTNPLSLQVLPANAGNAAVSKDIFLEVTSSASDMYVQEQVLLHVKLYRAVNLSQAQLSEPSMPHTVVKKLGEDKNYEVVREQRRFVVTERTYAVFPQQSGTLHIPALQFDGQIASGRGMF